MVTKRALIFLPLMFFLIPVALQAKQLPDVLVCKSNAKANQDWIVPGVRDVNENEWQGFEVNAKDQNDIGTNVLNAIFAGLNSSTPTIKMINILTGEPETSAEFKGRVVSRDDDALYLIWDNGPVANKIWTAAVEQEHKKAIISQVYHGATSLGAEVDSMDCK